MRAESTAHQHLSHTPITNVTAAQCDYRSLPLPTELPLFIAVYRFLHSTTTVPHSNSPTTAFYRRGTLAQGDASIGVATLDRKSTRLNSSHRCISYAVFCL